MLPTTACLLNCVVVGFIRLSDTLPPGGWRFVRRPEQVAGLVLVAPALPAWPETFRRSMTVGQQLQALARMALMRSDTAGLTYVRNMLTKQAERTGLAV